MRKLVRALGSNRCLGVYIGTRHVAWNRIKRLTSGVDTTPGASGVREVIAPETHLSIVSEIVTAHVRDYGPDSPLVVGLSPERTYVAGIIDVQPEELSAPAALLNRHGLFRSGNFETLAADVIGTERGLTSIAACARSLIKNLVAACGDAGARVVRIEPAVVTLAHIATQAVKRIKGISTNKPQLIHIIAVEDRFVVIMTEAGHPIACRSISVERKSAASVQIAELHAAVRGLEIYSDQRLQRKFDRAIVLHGGADMKEIGEGLRGTLGAEVHDVPGAPMDSATLALGVANAARGSQFGIVDLGRGFWMPGSLLPMVPQRETAAVAFAGFCLALWMWWGVWDVQGRVNDLLRQNTTNPILSSANDAALGVEREALTLEVQAVRRFMSTRQLWSIILAEIATGVPETATVDGIIAQEELTTGVSRADRRAKRQIVVSFVSQFPETAAVPVEAEAALIRLRGAPTISKSYPVSGLASLRVDRNKALKSDPDKVKFSILCRQKVAPDG